MLAKIPSGVPIPSDRAMTGGLGCGRRPGRMDTCYTPSGVPIPTRHRGDSGVAAEPGLLLVMETSLWESLSQPTMEWGAKQPPTRGWGGLPSRIVCPKEKGVTHQGTWNAAGFQTGTHRRKSTVVVVCGPFPQLQNGVGRR